MYYPVNEYCFKHEEECVNGCAACMLERRAWDETPSPERVPRAVWEGDEGLVTRC